MDAFDNDHEEQLMHQPHLRSLRISPVHGNQESSWHEQNNGAGLTSSDA